MAYLRARRSIKVAPGFKVNLNKHSVGMTVGGRGAHYSVNSAGTRTKTVGVPGTGVSWIDRQGGKRRSARSTRTARPAQHVQAPIEHAKQHAGILASHHERAYAKALECLRNGKIPQAYPLLEDAIASDTKHEAIAAHLISAIAHYKAGELEAAISHLDPVISTHGQVDHDPLLTRYELPDGYLRFDVPIGQHQAPGGTAGLGPVYLLVSAYASSGKTQQAAGVMQKLIADEPLDSVPPFVLIMLCALYQALGDWDEIIHLVGHFNITNVDDPTLVLRSYQAAAMANNDLNDAALEVLKDCLRSSKRDPGLLHAARYARAQIYLNTNKKALAKRDLSRIYSEDPNYHNIEQLLHELA
jgi:tetratricopeptide (TPR) repeat protein